MAIVGGITKQISIFISIAFYANNKRGYFFSRISFFFLYLRHGENSNENSQFYWVVVLMKRNR